MKRAALLGFCGLISLAGGCRVGPDYRPPANPPGAEAPLVSVRSDAETTIAPPDDWWKLYNDVQLDALLGEALAANADLSAAEANLAAAAAVLTAARAGRYPQTRIAVGGIDGRDATTDEILELTGQRPQTIWLLEDALEVSYEVDLFGRVRRSIEASHANAQAAAAARDSLRVVVAAENHARLRADMRARRTTRSRTSLSAGRRPGS